MGKIGLAVTPADPAVVYATIEAGEKEKGFYRSHDRGESWEKRSDYISNGTGPHYYQEIFASPTDPDLIYQVDVFLHVSRDAGKTFQKLETGRDKHSDNHVVWIDPSNGDHLLVGTDAGLYESFDQGESWRHFPNLPLSQFYRVALDSSEPFYYVLGGAQDLGTLLGPSRTLHVEGVRNQDWTVPIGADGHHVAFDPEEPAIAYMEFQNGNLFRYDRRSEEPLDIKPQPAPGDPPERWNWDSPLLVSPHHPARLYFASQRLWRSDDRGDTWTPVSGDLTRGQNRYELPMFGRVWSVDDLYDHRAMSQYATISTLSESPLVEGLLYAGTDDGLIQVSEDGGQSWREAGALPAVPELAFINAVAAGQAEGDVVFAVADAHKSGDTSPYVFESRDRGRTWRSIAGDLPAGTIVYGLAQDHVQPDLLFVGAEFGLYVSLNRGENWHRLSGAPTIAFRDLKLQRRDGDLVGASFGRGFYVLDDYTPLRELAAGALELELETEGHLFPVRDAWWYVPYVPMQARGMPTLGRSYFTAPNPPFGAVFTCFLAEKPQSARAARREREKALREEGGDIPFPGWEALQAEAVESEPQVLLLVRNEAGEPVRWVKGEAEAGLQRVAWDLRRPPVEPVELPPPESTSPWMTPPHGPLVAPGRYTVELVVVTAGELRQLGEPQSFVVRPLPAAPEGMDANELTAFQQAVGDLLRQVLGAAKEIGRSRERLDHLRAVLLQAPAADPALFRRIDDLTAALAALQTRLNGDESRRKLSEPATPSIQERVGRVKWGHWQTTQQPTTTQRRSFELAREDYGALRAELAALIEQDLPALEADLEAAGAPWTPGRRLV